MARKMKDSGIEWIGEIPEGWETQKLKYYATVTSGEILSRDEYDFSGDIPVIGSNGKIGTTYKSNNHSEVITTGRVGTIGTAQIVQDAWITDNALIIKSHSINRPFLTYVIPNFDFKFMLSGTAQPLITATKLKNQYIPVPSSEVQDKLVQYLNTQIFNLSHLISQACSSIELYKKLKQAVITQAVTKGVRGEREMKDSGNPWFGQIPTDWKLSRVGLHFSIILGKMLCNAPLNDTYTLEPYYCAADVHFDGVADGERKKMWFSPIEKDLYHVSVGDLLVVEGGAGAGGSAIVENQDSDTYIQNSIMIVRSKGNTDNRYLRYLLEFLVKQGYIDIVCNKATIPHFTKDKLSCVPFCLCPTGEQKEIADYLDAKCAEIDGLIAKKEQLVKELESYKKSLIYEVVTGKREV